MATGTNIRTYFNGQWHDQDLPIMKAADQGSWLGSSVFDGARSVAGLTPDLDLHCARVNGSAIAMALTPTCAPELMLDLIREGLRAYSPDAAVYIRPMYWGIDVDEAGIGPSAEKTGFAICLEEIAMPALDAATTLTRTRFRRPILENAVCNAKAGALYPNNARMLAEARSKGFANALVADAVGNVAETATANIFFVKGSTVFTPIPNGTFLAGITRQRHIANLRADGVEVVEKIVTFEEAAQADEAFLTGNFSKIMPVKCFNDTVYSSQQMAARARRLYWDWAANFR
jgi:branched-chain amino acid aminotransferase